MITDIKVLALCSNDIGNGYVRCSIRSRGPVINEIASHFNGGGHAMASGAKPSNFDEVDKLLKELDEACID